MINFFKKTDKKTDKKTNKKNKFEFNIFQLNDRFKINYMDICMLFITIFIVIVSITNSIKKKYQANNDLNKDINIDEINISQYIIAAITVFFSIFFILHYYSSKHDGLKTLILSILFIIFLLIIGGLCLAFTYYFNTYKNKEITDLAGLFLGDTSFNNQFYSVISFSFLLLLIFRYFSSINNPSYYSNIRTHDIRRFLGLLLSIFSLIIIILSIIVLLAHKQKIKENEDNGKDNINNELDKFNNVKGFSFIISIILGLLLILYKSIYKKYDIRSISSNSKSEKILDIISPIKIDKKKKLKYQDLLKM